MDLEKYFQYTTEEKHYEEIPYNEFKQIRLPDRISVVSLNSYLNCQKTDETDNCEVYFKSHSLTFSKLPTKEDVFWYDKKDGDSSRTIETLYQTLKNQYENPKLEGKLIIDLFDKYIEKGWVSNIVVDFVTSELQ